jgi:hypothetical protein
MKCERRPLEAARIEPAAFAHARVAVVAESRTECQGEQVKIEGWRGRERSSAGVRSHFRWCRICGRARVRRVHGERALRRLGARTADEAAREACDDKPRQNAAAAPALRKRCGIRHILLGTAQGPLRGTHPRLWRRRGCAARAAQRSNASGAGSRFRRRFHAIGCSHRSRVSRSLMARLRPLS